MKQHSDGDTVAGRADRALAKQSSASQAHAHTLETRFGVVAAARPWNALALPYRSVLVLGTGALR
jgi:hypothetical protein